VGRAASKWAKKRWRPSSRPAEGAAMRPHSPRPCSSSPPMGSSPLRRSCRCMPRKRGGEGHRDFGGWRHDRGRCSRRLVVLVVVVLVVVVGGGCSCLHRPSPPEPACLTSQ
jgi:hypothetical protein